MPGFVRAVAVVERSLLGSVPGADQAVLGVIDEARRYGLRVILLSDRSFRELRRGGDTWLRHFDGVVAESGTALKVGAGPVRRLAASAREALLEVLDKLDVDPHDALGVSGEDADVDLLGDLEVAVAAETATPSAQSPAGAAGTQAAGTQAAGTPAPQAGEPGSMTGAEPEPAGGSTSRADYRVTASGAAALRRVVDAARDGLPAVSPARHDVRLQLPALGDSDVTVPGAHANVLICAAGAPPEQPDVPVRLVDRWSAAGYSSVVFDLDGRHHGHRVDPLAPGWVEDLGAALRITPGPVVVDLSGAHGQERSWMISSGLAIVRSRRMSSGRPHWLVIDPADPVLADPDLPPEALDLTARGHCLVWRDHAYLPPLSTMDVVLPCSPGCPLPQAHLARGGHDLVLA